jgi:hypothetical protein
MAFESLNTLITRSGQATRNRPGGGIVLATDRQNPKNPGDEVRYTLRLDISPEMASKARFIMGDRVDILIDAESRQMMLKRVHEGGWKLAQSGKAGALKIQVRYLEGMPSVPTSANCTSVQLTDEGVVFTVPKSARFDINARKERDEEPKQSEIAA